MNSVNRLLVLAAGRGIGLDGFHKLNLVSPSTGENILQRYIRQLSELVTVVVGYRAPEIMCSNYNLNYVFNYNWFETGSAYSAALGLDSCPIIIVPSDLFIDEDAALTIKKAQGNVIFTSDTENRKTSAINIRTDRGEVKEIYTGPKRSGSDPEFNGIVRIQDESLVLALKKTCEANPSLSFSDCLNEHKQHFRVVELSGEINEINTIQEYFDFFEKDRYNAG